ncbi:MAG: response regulator [Chitinophagaceae bacterium]|nr:MAG: response regulator [Chitinophagaceae bacterium]
MYYLGYREKLLSQRALRRPPLPLQNRPPRLHNHRRTLLMILSKYIIYVEDDPDDVLLLREAFADIDGYDLLVLGNGAELLRYLDGTIHLPSLIILDINMPVLNGRETLKLLKQHPVFSGIPVVMFSTSGMASEVLFVSAYKTDLVVKPYDFHSLRYTVRHLVSYAVKAG